MSGRSEDEGSDLLSALFGLAQELAKGLHDQVVISEEVVIPSMTIDLERNFATISQIIDSIEEVVSELKDHASKS